MTLEQIRFIPLNINEIMTNYFTYYCYYYYNFKPNLKLLIKPNLIMFLILINSLHNI